MLSTNHRSAERRAAVENRAAAHPGRKKRMTTANTSAGGHDDFTATMAAAGRPAGARCGRTARGSRPAEVADYSAAEPAACRVSAAAAADDDAAAGANAYHPVRRRAAADGESGDGTAAVRVRSCGQRDDAGRPAREPSFAGYQNHYRGHRNHHHLHMWTSSCCWWLLILYAAVVVVASFARAAHSAKDVPVYHVRAVAGQQARLPCDISLVSDEEDSDPSVDGEGSLASGSPRDAVLLVLWYRDDLGTPIYSVDARSSATHIRQQYDTASYHLMSAGAERWSDRQVFGERAHFHINEVTADGQPEKPSKTTDQKKPVVSTYYSSELRIDRVGVKDAVHLYRCRVDFRLAQTRNSKVNLTVIVPPERMEITDLATGRELLRRQDNDGVNNKKDIGLEASSTTVVGPYVEGSDVRVRCRVYGGKPRPRVAWFRDNRLLKPESDDPEDVVGAQQQQETGAAAAVDGYATASVTTSSSTSTGGENSEIVIEVDLTLAGLTRSDLHTELTCRAWNYFYVDDDYSITVTNSGTSNIDTAVEKEQIEGDVDPIHWTPRQRQSSITAVVHVDMNFPPLTVQILPIADNGRYIDDDLPPFTQSSAKISTSSDGDDHLAVQSSKIREKSQLQPLTAGRKYELPCRAYGSRPPAKLTWWMDGRRLDTTRETTSSDGNSTTSVLTFVPVKPNKTGYRDDGYETGSPDYDGRLTCRAENPQHQLQKSTSQRKHAATAAGSAETSDDAVGSQFIQSTWLLRIQYVPYTLITLGTNLLANDIREGTDVYFDCTVDAVPPAYKVQWKRDGIELRHNTGGGSTGSGLTTTIIISNQSLVLQGVSRHETGHYSCGAENTEGAGPHSKPIYLDVLYAPTCMPSGSKSVQRVVYGVAKKETVTIACHVQANPQPTDYRWSFNNTISSIANSAGVGSSGSMNKQRYNGMGNLAGSSLNNSSRTLTYAPRTDFDYGTVECWAKNRVGTQSSPCVYHVIAAGRPDRVTNCTVMNSRAGMIHNGTRRLRSSRNIGSHIFIRCTEGYDGGLTQHLWAEIREATKRHRPDLDGDDLSGELVLNVTGIDEQDRQDFSNVNQDEYKKSAGNLASPPVKVFVARGLKPGAVYRVDVMASNAKGKSEPLTLMVSIPKAAGTDANESNLNGISNTMTTIDGQDPDRARNLLLEQQREQERDRRMQENGGVGAQGEFRMTPAMIIVLGVAGSLVVIACGAATYLRYQRDDDDEDPEHRVQNGADGTVVESDDTVGKPVTAEDEQIQSSQMTAGMCRGTAQPDNTVPNVVGHKKSMDKEYLHRTGRQIMQVGPSCSDQSTRLGSDVSVGPPMTLVPSPTSILRGAGTSNVYVGAKSGQHCKGVQLQSTDNPGLLGRVPSYRCRNPDIIPAPLQQMSPGAVYNNYNQDSGEPADAMTLIVASSTSSSPIHNHRQMVHQQQQHNRGYNNRGGQYHQGVMTLRRPVVLNNQYYGGGGGGGTMQRNALQQPDSSFVMVKDASVGPVSYHPQATSAYCTLPRSSYHQHHHHHHHQHSSHQHCPQKQQQQQQQQIPMMHSNNYRETDAAETPPPPPPPPWPSHGCGGSGAYPTVIVVPSSPGGAAAIPVSTIVAGTNAGDSAKPLQQTTVVCNKRESAV